MNFVVESGTPYLVGPAELYCSSGLLLLALWAACLSYWRYHCLLRCLFKYQFWLGLQCVIVEFSPKSHWYVVALQGEVPLGYAYKGKLSVALISWFSSLCIIKALRGACSGSSIPLWESVKRQSSGEILEASGCQVCLTPFWHFRSTRTNLYLALSPIAGLADVEVLTKLGLSSCLFRYCVTFITQWGVGQGDAEEVWWRLAQGGSRPSGYEPNFKAELPQGVT